uniref:Conserved hyporthetical plasmid protein n=1 Tax=Providencia rettgeri TaxID=587 RepID=B2G2Q0_PRORE|nr:conserved hyporthetical plasmid protein [Providencia rettgeri]
MVYRRHHRRFRRSDYGHAVHLIGGSYEAAAAARSVPAIQGCDAPPNDLGGANDSAHGHGHVRGRHSVNRRHLVVGACAAAVVHHGPNYEERRQGVSYLVVVARYQVSQPQQGLLGRIVL